MTSRYGAPAPSERTRVTGRDAEVAQHDLPLWGDVLVGREPELATLRRLLADPRNRLVTLTGPPGIGKTRLAVAAAAEYTQQGRRAVFVDLAPVSDPDLVLAGVARALRLDLHATANVADQLAAATLGETLVVLDNCEHVLDAAEDIGRVLASCPTVRLLATSRERLHLAAERELPVMPLAMPADAETVDLEALAGNPSVMLLLDRARRHNPEFALTQQNATFVVHACIRLEGLPLALELAAARLKVLSPGELAYRLGNRMDLLAGSVRDAPLRQRALRNAIGWSHDLLDAVERALFRRLSVFVGPWTLADAERVCAGTCDDMLAVVSSLVDKSLLRRLHADGSGPSEFGMLESLREYAAEQLALHGEADEMRARHAAHYAGLAVQFEAAVGLPEERVWWQRIAAYRADLRVALQDSVTNGRHEQALQLASALGWYSYTRGDLRHGQALIDTALSQVTDDTEGAVATAARLAGGILAYGRGELGRAESLLLDAVAYADHTADTRRGTVARAFLGHVARVRGRYDDARRWHDEALAGFQHLGNAQGVAWARHDLGLVACDSGELDAAATLLRESLRGFRELDYPWAVACCAWALATALCGTSSYAQAGPLLGEALDIFERVADPRGVARCLDTLAQLACRQACYEAAARLLGAAARRRDLLAVAPTEAEAAKIAAADRQVAKALGAEPAERLREDGRTMPLSQAVALATDVARGAAAGHTVRHRPTVPAPRLTPRERQVTALLASGRTNRQIGRMLGISEKTAEVHVQHVMHKLAARSRTEVAAWAASHSLDPDSP